MGVFYSHRVNSYSSSVAAAKFTLYEAARMPFTALHLSSGHGVSWRLVQGCIALAVNNISLLFRMRWRAVTGYHHTSLAGRMYLLYMFPVDVSVCISALRVLGARTCRADTCHASCAAGGAAPAAFMRHLLPPLAFRAGRRKGVSPAGMYPGIQTVGPVWRRDLGNELLSICAAVRTMYGYRALLHSGSYGIRDAICRALRRCRACCYLPYFALLALSSPSLRCCWHRFAVKHRVSMLCGAAHATCAGAGRGLGGMRRSGAAARALRLSSGAFGRRVPLSGGRRALNIR